MDDFIPGIYEYKGKQYLASRIAYGCGQLRGEQVVYYVPLYDCELPCCVRYKDEFLQKFTLVKVVPSDAPIRR